MLFTCLCHVAFTYAVYRLGTAIWDRRAGVAAALLAGSSFALLLYAARAYVDEPFLALVLWAAALEAERRRAARRRRAVWILLILAGLLRPEAWLLGGGYWLWLGWRARRAAVALLALAADRAAASGARSTPSVTGDPLFCLHSTSDLADELNRTARSPRSRATSCRSWPTPRACRSRSPASRASCGRGGGATPARSTSRSRSSSRASFTFFATSVAGLSVLPRYLTVPAVALCLPAGYLVTRSRALLGVAVVAGLAFVIVRADAFDKLATELRFIRSTHDDLTAVLHTPRGRAPARRCGPVTLPNYRLVPDTRWILDASQKQVGSRSARPARARRRAAAGRREAPAPLRLRRRRVPKTNAPPDGFLRGPSGAAASRRTSGVPEVDELGREALALVEAQRVVRWRRSR